MFCKPLGGAWLQLDPPHSLWEMSTTSLAYIAELAVAFAFFSQVGLRTALRRSRAAADRPIASRVDSWAVKPYLLPLWSGPSGWRWDPLVQSVDRGGAMENPHKSMQIMIITSKFVGICNNKLQSSCMNFVCINDQSHPIPMNLTCLQRTTHTW
jgi:hypothetical protein